MRAGQHEVQQQSDEMKAGQKKRSFDYDIDDHYEGRLRSRGNGNIAKDTNGHSDGSRTVSVEAEETSITANAIDEASDTPESVEQNNTDLSNEPAREAANEPTNEPSTSENDKENNQKKRKRKVYLKDEYGNLIKAGMQVVRRDRIEIKENGKWEPATVIDRAGKRKGPYEGWFNVELDNGYVFNEDLNRREIRILDDDSDPKRTRTEDEEALWIVTPDNGNTITDNLNNRQNYE